MTNLTNIYNNVADRRKQGLDFVGQERRHTLIAEQMRREDELAANIDFIERAGEIEKVTKIY